MVGIIPSPSSPDRDHRSIIMDPSSVARHRSRSHRARHSNRLRSLALRLLRRAHSGKPVVNPLRRSATRRLNPKGIVPCAEFMRRRSAPALRLRHHPYHETWRGRTSPAGNWPLVSGSRLVGALAARHYCGRCFIILHDCSESPPISLHHRRGIRRGWLTATQGCPVHSVRGRVAWIIADCTPVRMAALSARGAPASHNRFHPLRTRTFRRQSSARAIAAANSPRPKNREPEPLCR